MQSMGDNLRTQVRVVHGGSSMSGEETDLTPVGNREPLKVYELWSNRL